MMVRVKRSNSNKGFLQHLTVKHHFYIIVQALSIVACVGFYCILQSQENRMIAKEGARLGGGIGMAATAASASGAASILASSNKPYIVYGTAWKKERTAELVNKAVKAGFRFIDTACQPKHYNEPGVGNGWTSAAEELGLGRDDFWLQTKFTSINGQDPNDVPYDKNAPIEEQIRTSLQVSLKNLHTTYIDSWVMHSPERTIEKTIAAWRVMEEGVDSGHVRQLGISNCYDYDKFVALYDAAKHKPKTLQNRFYADSHFDTKLRQFCIEHGIKYQSFWTLTANRDALNKNQQLIQNAKSKNLTPQTYLFAFLMSLHKDSGYFTPLSGTTNEKHMMEDVAVSERIRSGEVFFETEDELRQMAKWLGMPDL